MSNDLVSKICKLGKDLKNIYAREINPYDLRSKILALDEQAAKLRKEAEKSKDETALEFLRVYEEYKSKGLTTTEKDGLLEGVNEEDYY